VVRKDIDGNLVLHRVLDKGVFGFPNRKVHGEVVVPKNKLDSHPILNQNLVAASWRLERE